MDLLSIIKSISHYNDYKETREKKFLDLFLKVSKIMISKMKKVRTMNGWLHKKKMYLPGYPKITKSYSSLFNAFGLDMLIRYKQFAKNKRGINCLIFEVLNSFEIESDKGGTLKKERNEFYYLEYSYGNESPVVWNGFLSSLIGLYEVYKYEDNKKNKKKAKKLFDLGFKNFNKEHR